MSKNWDKAVPSIEIWKECLRVLKPGAFAFVMSIPRQDCLARMICNLQDAGFETGFTSLYWTTATGFPKAMNIPKAILKRFLQASLQDVSRSLHKDEDSQSDYPCGCHLCGEPLQRGVVIVRNVSPLRDDALKYSRLSSPLVEIQTDTGYTHKVSCASLSFHHATPDLKPLSSWLTILSGALESNVSGWLPLFSCDNWGLGDRVLLQPDCGQRSDIRLSNNVAGCAEPVNGEPESSYHNSHKEAESLLTGDIDESRQNDDSSAASKISPYIYSELDDVLVDGISFRKQNKQAITSFPSVFPLSHLPVSVYYTSYCPACQERTSNKLQKMIGSFAGMQVKPAVEVVLVAMRPLSEKTYLDQAMKNGKGVTWLGKCMIPCESDADKEKFLDSWDSEREDQDSNLYKLGLAKQYSRGQKQFKPRARFPANLLISDDVLNDGKTHTAGDLTGQPRTENTVYNTAGATLGRPRWHKGDSGSFSRYFSLDSWWEKKLKELPESVRKTFPFLITPKPSKREKNLGCEELPKGKPPASARSKPAPGRKNALGEPRANSHPTVKSLKLFSYLITLGSRPGDLVCDPFCGSGTTCIAAELLGRNYIGIDNDPDSVRIARARLAYWGKQLKLF